jgi:transcriptional regulator with XRE-family HTH domain
MTSAGLTFGEWLDDQLRQRRWSQSAFADAVGVARPTVNSWVNNVQPPRRRVLPLIAKVLGVSSNEVLVRAGYPPVDPDYVLPGFVESGDRQGEIDLSDPLVSFAAHNQHKLTDAQKRAMIEFMKEFLREEGESVG